MVIAYVFSSCRHSATVDVASGWALRVMERCACLFSKQKVALRRSEESQPARQRSNGAAIGLMDYCIAIGEIARTPARPTRPLIS